MLSSCVGAGYTSVIPAATCMSCRQVTNEYICEISLRSVRFDGRDEKIEPLIHRNAKQERTGLVYDHPPQAPAVVMAAYSMAQCGMVENDVAKSPLGKNNFW